MNEKLWRVEIFFIKLQFIVFDFGNFALVIEYDPKTRRNNAHRFCEADAYLKFMFDWGYRITDPCVNLVSKQVGKEIEEILLAWNGQTSYQNLNRLLWAYFSYHMRRYGR